jgi:type IV pilus assembly protein PilA
MHTGGWLRSSADQNGYSMVELMVVVMVIGVLIAIGLPSFLGAKTRAQDRQTQASLRTAMVAGLTDWSGKDSFTGFDIACGVAPDSCVLANTDEGSVTWVGPGDPDVLQVSIVVASGQDLLLVSRSPTGTYFCEATSAGTTTTGAAASFAALDSIPECSGGW